MADRLDITGGLDGYVLRFGGHVIARARDWDGIHAAHRAAVLAQFLLSALLAKSEARP